MSMKQQLSNLTDLRPRLTVIGVGGAGCNAINNMIAAGLSGVDFVVANTDAQALAASSAEHRVQLGIELTEGLGAGSRPEIGEAAAEEAIETLRTQIAGSHMVFIASGMGGGTGTGAAAVIARVAKELGILTVGIVTKPFHFEGTRRMRIADIGVSELKKYVDTLIVIPNQNLFRVANERTTFAEAFVLADQVLYSGVACIVDLIIKEGLINLDFADVRTVMSGMGTAMMGTGEASGERRAILAAEEAIANPLLDDVSLRGARGLLLSISGGRDLTLYEVDEAASRVREEVDPDANIIVGATFDDSLGDRVRVSIVASGMMRQNEQTAGPIGQPSLLTVQPTPLQRTSVDGLRGRDFVSVAQSQSTTAPVRPPFNQDEAEDAQRRLTAALQQSEAIETQSARRWSATQGSTKSAKTGPPELWEAPGRVLIEEVGAVVAKNPGTKSQTYTPAPLETAPIFTPEMTTDIRRSGRRMPELAEFPIVGQREYRQRSDGAPLGESVPTKRPGLFERLAGKGRWVSDSVTVTAQPTQPSANLKQKQVPSVHERAVANSGWPTQSPAAPSEQSVELPEFISRDRK